MTPSRLPRDGRSPAARAFDDALAARARETLDASAAPADTDAGWARLGAALAAAPLAAVPRAAADRPAVRAASGRLRRAGVLAGVALVAAAVGWLAAERLDAPERRAEVAVAATAPPEPVASDPAAPSPGSLASSAPPVGARPGAPARRHRGGSRVGVRARQVAPLPVRDALAEPGLVTPGPRYDVTSPLGGEGQGEGPAPAEAPGPDRAAPGPPVFAARATLPLDPPLAPRPRDEPRMRLFATASAGPVSLGGDFADGAATSAGLSAEWTVARGVRLTGVAGASYLRAASDADGAQVAQTFSDVALDLGESARVGTRQALTALALELPLGVSVDVARVGRGRLTVGAGVVSTVYLAQTFRDEGVVLTGAPAGGPPTFAAFDERERVPALRRVDLARQVALSVGVAGRGPLGADVFVRLPLGGVTSRDLPLAHAGLRVQVALD